MKKILEQDKGYHDFLLKIDDFAKDVKKYKKNTIEVYNYAETALEELKNNQSIDVAKLGGLLNVEYVKVDKDDAMAAKLFFISVITFLLAILKDEMIQTYPIALNLILLAIAIYVGYSFIKIGYGQEIKKAKLIVLKACLEQLN